MLWQFHNIKFSRRHLLWFKRFYHLFSLNIFFKKDGPFQRKATVAAATGLNRQKIMENSRNEAILVKINAILQSVPGFDSITTCQNANSSKAHVRCYGSNLHFGFQHIGGGRRSTWRSRNTIRETWIPASWSSIRRKSWCAKDKKGSAKAR